MASIYIASGLANWERVRRLQQEFINRGLTIAYDWTVHWPIDPKIDYAQLAATARSELSGILQADHLLVVLPGGRGTHFELGAMAAKWARLTPILPITILHDQDDVPIPTSFHYLQGITRVGNEEDAIVNVMRSINL